MLIERDPESWQDLQNLTAKIFAEMGCASEVEKEVETARGVVEVDVYVRTPPIPRLLFFCVSANTGPSLFRNTSFMLSNRYC